MTGFEFCRLGRAPGQVTYSFLTCAVGVTALPASSAFEGGDGREAGRASRDTCFGDAGFSQGTCGGACCTSSSNPTSILPGLFVANGSRLQRPRPLCSHTVSWVVLEHLSCGSGSPPLGPSAFTRARESAEGG